MKCFFFKYKQIILCIRQFIYFYTFVRNYHWPVPYLHSEHNLIRKQSMYAVNKANCLGVPIKHCLNVSAGCLLVFLSILPYIVLMTSQIVFGDFFFWHFLETKQALKSIKVKFCNRIVQSKA